MFNSDSVMAINGYNPDSEAANIQQYQQSFVGWPGKVPAVKLAIAGFRYLGPGDQVICDTCGLKFYNWDGSEKPTDVHRSNSPRCEFINKWFRDSTRVAPSEPPPVFPQFSDISSRLDSFAGWLQTMTHQSPSTLAAEGFYYIGSADRTCCFQCGIRLRDWDVDDDPFDCHKEYAPGCSFIKRRERERQGQLETSNEQSQVFENGISTLTIGGATSGLKTSNNEPSNQATNTVTPNVTKTVTPNVTKTEAPNVTNTLTPNVTSAVSGKHTDLCNDPAASVNVADSGQSDDVVIDWQCPKVLAVLDFGCTKEEITKAFKQCGGDNFRDAKALFLAIMNTS